MTIDWHSETDKHSWCWSFHIFSSLSLWHVLLLQITSWSWETQRDQNIGLHLSNFHTFHPAYLHKQEPSWFTAGVCLHSSTECLSWVDLLSILFNCLFPFWVFPPQFILSMFLLHWEDSSPLVQISKWLLCAPLNAFTNWPQARLSSLTSQLFLLPTWSHQ